MARRWFVILAFGALSSFRLDAVSVLDTARGYEAAGKVGLSIESYRSYLTEAFGAPDYGSVLLHASTLFTNPAESAAFLALFVSQAPTPRDRDAVYLRMGSLYEYSGDMEQAVRSYRAAYSLSRPFDFSAYLKSGFIDVELGNIDDAIHVARTTLSFIRDPANRVAAAKLLAMAAVKSPSPETYLPELNALLSLIETAENPSSTYRAYLYFLSVKAVASANRMKNVLLKRFPNSPETMLLRGKANPFPSPGSLF